MHETGSGASKPQMDSSCSSYRSQPTSYANYVFSMSDGTRSRGRPTLRFKYVVKRGLKEVNCSDTLLPKKTDRWRETERVYTNGQYYY